MKLSDWAKQNGLSYRTAWRLFQSGKLPVAAQQLKTGTILISEPKVVENTRDVFIYARVSSHDQKKDLDSQVARLCKHATSKGLRVTKVVTEIGSGLNGRRKKLVKLLGDAQAKNILIEHRDRLTRFGFEYLEALLESSGRSIQILEKNEVENDKNDLVRDAIDVLTSLCARLYGKRSAENRARRAFEFIEKDHGNDTAR